MNTELCLVQENWPGEFCMIVFAEEIGWQRAGQRHVVIIYPELKSQVQMKYNSCLRPILYLEVLSIF